MTKKFRLRKLGLISLSVIVFFVLATLVLHWIQEPLSLDKETKKLHQERFIRLNHGCTRFNYVQKDTNNIVVFIHGGGILGYEVWSKNIGVVSNQGFSTLEYDQYGRGYSAKPFIKYDLDLLYNQFIELIDSLGLTHKKINIVALSMGAKIAMKYLDQFPGRINKVAFIGPSLLGKFEPNIFLRTPVISQLLMTDFWRFHYIEGRRKEFVDMDAFEEYKSKILYFSKIRGFKRVYLSTWLNCLSEPVDKYVKRLPEQESKKAMIIYGEKDPYTLENSVKKLQTFLPLATFHMIRSAGHSVNFEKPNEVNALLLSFFSSSKMKD